MRVAIYLMILYIGGCRCIIILKLMAVMKGKWSHAFGDEVN